MVMKTAAELDHSPEAFTYFHRVVWLLVSHHEISLDFANALVNVYFSLDVDPLERALVMHSPVEEVAAQLAQMSREQAT